MKKIGRPIIVLISIFVCVGLVFGVKVFVNYLRQDLFLTKSDRSKGDPKAPIKIVEFIDFQCGPCALGSEYLDKFMKEHPGVVRLEVKHFPLGKHQHAMVGARYAECAARQGKFWPLHDLLLQRQEQWVDLDNVTGIFDLMVQEANLDFELMDICLSDKSVDKAIKSDKREGRSIEVMATPTFFVNERKVVGKASLEPELKRLIKKIGK